MIGSGLFVSEFLQFHLVNLGPGGSFDLVNGMNTLGRAEDNRCVVPDDSVSSAHCFIDVSEARVLVRDLGSTNGTYLEGMRVVETLVVPGQVMRFGLVEYRVESRTVRISIPEIPFTGEELFPIFDDGSAACYRHQSILATAQCQQCSRTYCGDCVRSLKLKVGNAVYLCPDCSGRCTFIEPSPKTKGKGASLVAKISDFLGIRK